MIAAVFTLGANIGKVRGRFPEVRVALKKVSDFFLKSVYGQFLMGLVVNTIFEILKALLGFS